MPTIPLVQDVMMRDCKSIDGITKVSDALAMMKTQNIHAVLIYPRDATDVYGILTLKDIARKVIGLRRRLFETHVYEIMSKPVLTVPSKMPVPYAARFLTQFNVSYAIVMENDDIVGVVSLNGIVNLWEEN